MKAGKHLHDAPACGIAPQRQIAEVKLCDDRFQILDVVLDEIRGAWIPVRVAVYGGPIDYRVFCRCI